MTIKKRTGKRSIPTWDQMLNVGMKGKGKSQSSIPFATDLLSVSSDLPKTPKSTLSYTDTGGNSGSWTSPYHDGSVPYTAQPYQNPYLPTTTGFPHGWYGGSISPLVTPLKEKPKHDPKEMMGKMVAFATVRVQGIEHTGVLFVRRCGAWKLIDCRTMNRVAGGSEHSPLPDVTIHYIIYAEETDPKPKTKSRFDDIDMRIDEEDKDGNET
jgi:hypothetical protein